MNGIQEVRSSTLLTLHLNNPWVSQGLCLLTGLLSPHSQALLAPAGATATGIAAVVRPLYFTTQPPVLVPVKCRFGALKVPGLLVPLLACYRKPIRKRFALPPSRLSPIPVLLQAGAHRQLPGSYKPSLLMRSRLNPLPGVGCHVVAEVFVTRRPPLTDADAPLAVVLPPGRVRRAPPLHPQPRPVQAGAGIAVGRPGPVGGVAEAAAGPYPAEPQVSALHFFFSPASTDAVPVRFAAPSPSFRHHAQLAVTVSDQTQSLRHAVPSSDPQARVAPARQPLAPETAAAPSAATVTHSLLRRHRYRRQCRRPEPLLQSPAIR